jgi:hypothetical protein
MNQNIPGPGEYMTVENKQKVVYTKTDLSLSLSKTSELMAQIFSLFGSTF